MRRVPSDLDLRIPLAARNRGLDRTLEAVEREYIADVLAANDNNLTRSAAILGIDRKTLRDKLKKWGGN